MPRKTKKQMEEEAAAAATEEETEEPTEESVEDPGPEGEPKMDDMVETSEERATSAAERRGPNHLVDNPKDLGTFSHRSI